jgi:alpha-L-fucosidase
MTMNETWGYKSYANNWKSTETLVRNLIDIASKGGNYLLNVGPRADGSFPQESIELLKGIGGWMKVNGEAIYGTTASPFGLIPWGRCTKKETGGNTILYFSVFDWPANGKLQLPAISNKITACNLLAGNAVLKISKTKEGLVVNLPAKMPDSVATVVKLVVKGKIPVHLEAPKAEMKSGLAE